MSATIQKWLRNSEGKIRNGWWMLLFALFVVISRPIFFFVNGSLKDLGIDELWLKPIPFIFILVITWLCLKLRKEKLADVGLSVNGQWFKQVFAGLVIGSLQIGIVVLFIALVGGVELKIKENIAYNVVLIGFYSMLFASLLEELLFRGFLFQRLIAGLGFVWAQVILGGLFAFGHVTDPELTLSAQIWGGLDLVLAAMVFGLAYYRTQSLALPVGLHLGWNWFQGHVLGFAVSSHDQQGVFEPVISNMPEWLTGGSFGPEATVFAVASEIIMLVILWRWKGTVNAQTTEPEAKLVTSTAS